MMMMVPKDYDIDKEIMIAIMIIIVIHDDGGGMMILY